MAISNIVLNGTNIGMPTNACVNNTWSAPLAPTTVCCYYCASNNLFDLQNGTVCLSPAYNGATIATVAKILCVEQFCSGGPSPIYFCNCVYISVREINAFYCPSCDAAGVVCFLINQSEGGSIGLSTWGCIAKLVLVSCCPHDPFFYKTYVRFYNGCSACIYCCAPVYHCINLNGTNYSIQ